MRPGNKTHYDVFTVAGASQADGMGWMGKTCATAVMSPCWSVSAVQGRMAV